MRPPIEAALKHIDPFEGEEQTAAVTDSFIKDVVRSYSKNKPALIGFIIVAILVFVALFAPFISPHDPYEINLDEQLLAPNHTYWFGTDKFGRDLLTRIMYGARISLLVGLIPTFISMVSGTFMGIVSGYYGGKIDFFIMRLADTMIAFPSLLLAMVVMYTLGASLLNIFIALALVGWAGTARVVRSQTLALKEKEYIEAARANGVRKSVIMVRHIFPNIMPMLVVLFSLGIPEAIMWESSLSFLGVGVQPPMASWGLLVAKGKAYLFSAPWVAILPGIAILITVMAFNFMGDGLRDALDPYMKD